MSWREAGLWALRGAVLLGLALWNLCFLWAVWSSYVQEEAMLQGAARYMMQSACKCQAEGLRACANVKESAVPSAIVRLWPAVQQRLVVHATAFTQLYGEWWSAVTAPVRWTLEWTIRERGWLVPMHLTVALAWNFVDQLRLLVVQPLGERRARLEYEATAAEVHRHAE